MNWTAYLLMCFRHGAFITMTITLASIAVGAMLAFIFGILRVGEDRSPAVALCYTEVFPRTSLSVQLSGFTMRCRSSA